MAVTVTSQTGYWTRVRVIRITGVMLAGLVLGIFAAGAAQAAPGKADRDRDGVFDDLEARVHDVPPGRALKVIVTLDADASRARVGRLEDDVASLDAKDRFEVVDAFAAVVDAGEVRKLSRE